MRRVGGKGCEGCREDVSVDVNKLFFLLTPHLVCRYWERVLQVLGAEQRLGHVHSAHCLSNAPSVLPAPLHIFSNLPHTCPPSTPG